MADQREVGAQDAEAERGLPLELAARVLAQVELFEDLLEVDHLGRQRHLGRRVRRPVAHRQNVHRQVQARQLGLVQVRRVLERNFKKNQSFQDTGPLVSLPTGRHLFEGDVDVFGELHVLEHALQFGGEAAAALLLQLGQHALLGVDAGRLAHQQPLRQVLDDSFPKRQNKLLFHHPLDRTTNPVSASGKPIKPRNSSAPQCKTR